MLSFRNSVARGPESYRVRMSVSYDRVDVYFYRYVSPSSAQESSCSMIEHLGYTVDVDWAAANDATHVTRVS